VAIDTANKRRSIGMHHAIGVDPIPDGAIDSADRAQLAWLYSGIILAEPVVEEEITKLDWNQVIWKVFDGAGIRIKLVTAAGNSWHGQSAKQIFRTIFVNGPHPYLKAVLVE
jgi:hypothetical protein